LPEFIVRHFAARLVVLVGAAGPVEEDDEEEEEEEEDYMKIGGETRENGERTRKKNVWRTDGNEIRRNEKVRNGGRDDERIYPAHCQLSTARTLAIVFFFKRYCYSTRDETDRQFDL